VAGVGARVKEIPARAMNGELDFEGALLERVGLLAGLPDSVIDEVIATRISFMPGGHDLLGTMKANGAYCALVSGGFTAFVGYVVEALGFHERRVNTLLVTDGYLSGDVARPILGREAKVQALLEISDRLGLGHADVLAVGAGANDIGMLGLDGSGVALHAKPSVAAQCDIRINPGDLSALLYIQGYAVTGFALPSCQRRLSTHFSSTMHQISGQARRDPAQRRADCLRRDAAGHGGVSLGLNPHRLDHVADRLRQRQIGPGQRAIL